MFRAIFLAFVLALMVGCVSYEYSLHCDGEEVVSGAERIGYRDGAYWVKTDNGWHSYTPEKGSMCREVRHRRE